MVAEMVAEMAERAHRGTIRWRQCAAPQAGALSPGAQQPLDKEALLALLARAFDFPDYFGYNWDAAYDLLLDRVDGLGEPAVWRFWIDADGPVDAGALACWVQLLEDVSRQAAVGGCELCVEIQSNATERLQRLSTARTDSD